MNGFFEFITNGPVVVAITIGFVYMLRIYMQGGKFTKKVNIDGKVVIVTGCNTGIGKETVRELARSGATIYMACRNMNKSEQARHEIVMETHNENIFCRECDLASFDSIRKFVETFKKEQNRLDLLINNAGVMHCPHLLTKDGFEMQIGVNHMGHFLLTNLLLDLLKQSEPSRIVVLSSLAHTMGGINKNDLNSEKSYDKNKAYIQSKLANVLFTRELSKRLEGTKVTVNALHPGVVDTDLFRHYGFLISNIMKPLMWPFLKTAKNGAQTTLFAALDPQLETVSGKYFSDCALKEAAAAGKDDAMAEWLWAESEKWTKLNIKQ